VRHLTGPAGQLLGDLRYSPFGEIIELNGPPALFGFTGEPQDVSSGLTYLRARYYQPALGRFLTQDSLIPDVTNGQALNAYTYVYNDPINLVDPSGHVPSVGNAAVWTAQQTPDSWKGAIRDFADGGLRFIDNWYSQPDDCDCDGSSRPDRQALAFAWNWPANQAVHLGWDGVTTPGRRVATEVIGRASGRLTNGQYVNRILAYQTNYDVTKWGRQGPVNDARYRVRSFDKGYTVYNKNGVAQMKVRNPRWQWAGGWRGARGTVAGSGIIDGAFQLIDDILIQGLCLSPNQIFWRASVAFGFGLLAGGAGLATGAAAAAFLGTTGFALTGIAFTASFTTTYVTHFAKQQRVDQITRWAE
jgi:RHS repeat-associated protein